MNDEDLHDILEKIGEKTQAKVGMYDLGKNLGSFRNSLLEEGFSRNESFTLAAIFLAITLNKNSWEE